MERTPLFRCCQPALLFEAVGGDAGVFLDLKQVFHRETIDRFEDIAKASAAGAFADMGLEAHSLKGTVGVVGATSLVQLLQEIEFAGLRHQRPCSDGQLSQLRQLLQSAREDMDAYAATLQTS